MTKSKWIGIDDAIAQVMRSRNCSRATARRLVAEAVESRKVRTRITRTGLPLRELTPGQVGKLLDEGAEHEVLVTLDEFMRYYKLTWAETLGELQAGRLIAGSDEGAHLMLVLNQPLPLQRFTVSAGHINEWLHNPQTPPDLVARNTLM